MSPSVTTPSAPPGVENCPREVLTLRLGGEAYGLDILKVQEIRSWERPTPLPNVPPSILGIVNLRGTVVPVIDLRIRLGVGPPTYDASTIVVVLCVARRVVGLVVDGVSEVTRLAADAVRPPPDVAVAAGESYMLGLGFAEGRTLILLDIDKLIDATEVRPVPGPDVRPEPALAS